MKIKMSSKIKQVDFNSKLEEILEKKDFDVTVKNLLLSMLYKIENSYKDYSKVKVNIKNKDEKITEVLHIISEYCDKIELVTPKTVASKVLEEENKKCIIDIKKGYIKTYANEQSMLLSQIAIKPSACSLFLSSSLTNKTCLSATATAIRFSNKIGSIYYFTYKSTLHFRPSGLEASSINWFTTEEIDLSVSVPAPKTQ